MVSVPLCHFLVYHFLEVYQSQYSTIVQLISQLGTAAAEEATQNRESYSDYQDTFVWRKITLLWKDSKIRGFSPLSATYGVQ